MGIVKIKQIGRKTTVKKVVVGTPIKAVTAGGFSINNIAGVDTSNAEEGAVLVYDAALAKFVARKNLADTNINGGQY